MIIHYFQLKTFFYLQTYITFYPPPLTTKQHRNSWSTEFTRSDTLNHKPAYVLLPVLTNQRRVLRVLTNERRVCPCLCSLCVSSYSSLVWRSSNVINISAVFIITITSHKITSPHFHIFNASTKVNIRSAWGSKIQKSRQIWTSQTCKAFSDLLSEPIIGVLHKSWC